MSVKPHLKLFWLFSMLTLLGLTAGLQPALAIGPATSLTFLQQPTNTTAATTIAPVVTVKAKDATNAAVAGVSITLSLTSGTGTLSGTLTQVTDASGVASFNDLSIDKTGSKQITAGSGALAATSNPFTITLGTATNIAFTQQPGNTIAGAAITPAVTVSVSDAGGNPEPNASVTVTLSAGSGTLSGTTVRTTNGAGIASFSGLSIDKTGSKQITASSGGLTVASTSFSVTPGAAATIAFTQQPSNAVAGASIAPPVVVRLLDSNSNPIPNASVTLSKASGPGTLSGTLAQSTDGSGNATFANLSFDKVGGYQITADGAGLTATSSTFTISVGAAASITFTQQPTGASSGAIITPATAVQVLDAGGNPVVGAGVSLDLTSGTGTLSGTTTSSTNASGKATFSNLSIDKTGSKQITASSGGLTVASTSFSVTPGAAATIAFTQQPSNAVAGATITPPVTIQVLDASGNLVTTSSAPVTLTLTSGTGTLAGTTTQNAASGIATFSNLSVSTAGTKQVTAASAGLAPATSSPFTITTGAPSQLVFGQPPTGAASGATITPAVTVLIKDSVGNVVTTSSAPVTLTLTSGTGTLAGTTTQAAVNGVATFSDLSISTAGAGKILTASSTGLTSAASSAFAITAGAPSQLVFTTQPAVGASFASGATVSPALTVQIEDAAGNPVAQSNVSITLSLVTGSTGTISGIPNPAPKTDASGKVTYSNVSIDLVGSKQIVADSATLPVSAATSNPITITPGTAAKLAFGQQPTDTPSGTAITPPVTVLVEDTAGNVVTTSSASISLTLPAAGGNPERHPLTSRRQRRRDL